MENLETETAEIIRWTGEKSNLGWVMEIVSKTYRCSQGHEIRISSDLDSALIFTLGSKSRKVAVCLFCLADKLESLNLPKLEEVKNALA